MHKGKYSTDFRRYMKVLRSEDGRRNTGWLKDPRTYLIEPLLRESLNQSLPDVSINNSRQTLSDFSNELKLPTELLIEQFSRAGITNLKPEEIITEHDKTALLNYLRKEPVKQVRVALYENDLPQIETQLVVTDVNDELMFYLAKKPELIYELGSRKFEELIAKLFADRGHEVNLTKSTRDGGYDIFAKIKNDISEFIILAECKKYKPDNKVGVEIVRGLYGVTEANKANQGLIITSSFFTKDAQQEQLRIGNRIGLKDYNDLVEWLKPYSK